MAELTIYTSTSDGQVYRLDVPNYTTAHDSTVGTVAASIYTLTIGQSFYLDEYNIYRGFLFFDTSAIPAGVTITGAILSISIKNDYSNTDFNIVIRNGQPTYPHDPLVVGDFLYTHYTGDGGSVNTSGIAGVGYLPITLNSTGLSWINLSGVTKLALISSRDISATAPTGLERIDIAARDAGEATAAKLVITYTYPTVTTQIPTNISRADPTTVTANGLIENIGIYDITTRGFKYGLTEDDTWDVNEEGTFSAGVFSLTLTGLTADTTYFIRAYAVGAWGTKYGSYLEFRTAYPYGANKVEIKSEATASAGDIALVGGKRSLTIENHLIQTQTIADIISAAYLADYKDQKTKLRVTKPTPAPYEVGDTIERISAKLPYYAAVSALISYAAAVSAIHPYNLAGRDMIIRKLNVSFSAGNYISIIELEN